MKILSNNLDKNFKILKLGFGCCQIGGPTQLGNKHIGMGTQTKNNSIEAIKCAINHGINFFDTADIYGNGKSEKILGQACKDISNVFICTKFGNRFKNNKHYFDSSTTHLINSVKNSLQRLKKDTLDIILLHSPPKNISLSSKFKKTLTELKENYKIRYFGISFSSVNDAIEFINYDSDLDFIEIIFNIVDRRAEKVLFKLCKKNNIKIIARMPLASGFLSNSGFNKTFKSNDFRKNISTDFLEWMETIEQTIYFKFNKKINIAELSLRYVLSKEEVFVVIPGMRNKLQVNSNIISYRKGILDINYQKIINKLPEFYKGWK